MIVEVYESEEEGSITVIVQGCKEGLSSDSVLLRTIEGDDWNDCMTKHHELMGFEPYKPF
jgi:hypothetical protein